MTFHPDQLRQLTSDRQQQLRSEAAVHRLAGPLAARTRFAHVLRRTADRLDAATSPCGHVRRLLGART